MREQGMRHNLQEVRKFFVKLGKRFSNYNNSKKRFVLYLIILVILLLCPLVTVSGKAYHLVSGAYFKSFIIIAVSLLFLFGWNLSMGFKWFLVHFFSLREDEPLVDFAFLWVIMSVFVGIVDTIGIVEIPVRIQQTLWASIVQVWLLFGLIWSLVSLWVVAKKSSKKAKILNIVEEPTSHKHIEISNQPKRPVQHLFDELDE